MCTNLLDTDAKPLPAIPRPLPANEASAAELPAKFRDPETGEVMLDKLLKSYLALEKRVGRSVQLPGEGADAEQMGAFHRALGVPEKPEDYCIECIHPAIQSDPAVNARLHQAGFTPSQAQLVYDLAQDHVLPQIERLVGELHASRERERLVERFGGEARYREAARSIGAWGRKALSPAAFQALSSSYDGVLALEQMMKNKEPGLGAFNARPAEETLSEADLVKLMQDPRYWKKRDPEILAKVTEGFRRLYPG